MKKKGFTLIELLAVIVILAIIALISVPIILGVIDKAKRGAFKDSVLSAYNALEYKLAELKITKVPTEEEGGLEVLDLPLKSDFTGGRFFSRNGQIYVDKIRNNEFCAYGTIDKLTIDKTTNCDNADSTPPDIENEGAVSFTSTSNSVDVNISEGFAVDKDSKIEKYVITITGPDNYKASDELTDFGSVTFNSLINNTEYCVNVAVFNPSGQSKELSECIKVKTSTFDAPTYKVTPESGWAISKTVEITYPDTQSDDYVNEYSLDGAQTWHEYTEPVVLTDFGATSISMTARVRDKNNDKNYVIASDLTVTEIYLTTAQNVSFTPDDASWEVDNVQDALDWLRSN